MDDNTITVRISHDGIILPWHWFVYRRSDGAMRGGDAWTKERAERKAVKARLDIERNDIMLEV
jgi:hypothetical protein